MELRRSHTGLIPGFLVLASAGLLVLRLTPRLGVSRLSRRAFLLGAAGSTAAVTLAACGSSGKSGGKGDITISKADVPAVNAKPFTNDKGGFYVVHMPQGVMALSWTCTHQGCKVPWKESERDFHCPCHGSKYAYNGTVTHGPAGRPLDLFAVSVEKNGDLVVNTDKRTKRKDFEPSQAVPYTV